jgi:hypothetical protein
MKDIDPVADQLTGRDMQRVFAWFDQAAADAIFDIGQFHPAATDRAAPEIVQAMGGELQVEAGAVVSPPAPAQPGST